MIQLLKIWSFSHYRLLKVNTLLTLLGIAFGVAIFTAIQIANQNIRDSFRWTIEQIAGKGAIEIKGAGGGFSEEAIVIVRAIPGIKEAMPVILQPVMAGDQKRREEVMVMGVDLIQDAMIHDIKVIQPGRLSSPDLELLLDPASIMITSFLADRFHLKPGSELIFQAGSEQIQTRVAGILQFQNGLSSPYGGYFAMMDIAGAQRLFHKTGKLDRINLLLEENVPEEGITQKLESALPGLHIESPREEKKMVDSLLGSFNLNIKALSEVSILVGMFLIYQTLSLLVVRRKVEIGILKSVGVSGREIFWLILLEAFLLGLIGSTAGIGLGVLTSKTILKAVSLTISSLYLKVYTQTISFPMTIGLTALLTGLGVSLAAAVFPAREASQVAPRDNLIRQGEIQPPRCSTRLLSGGLASLLFSFFLSTLPSYHGRPLFGYLSALFLLTGLSLIILPAFYLLYKSLRLPLMKNRMFFFKVAGSGFFRQPARNGVAVAALMTSVALLISVTLMIQSFRKTLEVWFDQTIKADLVIEPKEWLNPGNLPLIPPESAESVKKLEGVAAVDLFREDHLFYREEPFLLTSRDLEIHRIRSQYLFTKGDSSQKLKEVIDRDEILISERFSLQHHLNEGALITLNTPLGPVAFKVGGVFYDYTTQGGKIVIDRSLYLKFWKDDRVNILAIYLKNGDFSQGKVPIIKEALNPFLEEKGLMMISNQEIKTKVMEIFDQTFSITRVLEWITIFISLLGIVNMLLGNLLEQKKEIGILRSLGASPNQIGGLVLFEALWMTMIACFLGGIGGTALSLILIYVINKQSFFWTIQFNFSGMILIRTFLIVVLTALLASFYPASKASREGIAEAVHYE